MKALPDTSYVVDLLRGEPAAVDALRALQEEGARLSLSSVVAFELRFGFAWRGDRMEEAAFEALVAQMSDAPFDDHAARHAADLQVRMARAGQPLGQADAMIAGTAAAAGMVLVTSDKVLSSVAAEGQPVRFVQRS